VAYFAFLSRGMPQGVKPPWLGIPKLAPRASDPAAGGRIFASTCARCHGASGEGTGLAPPTWGSRSYAIGAGMARLQTAASFIRWNMPFDRPGTLTDQQAYDVAAFVLAHPRPDTPGKELDYPNGDPPPDTPYPIAARRR
jgi:thiosulfate dehydrogenase